MNIDLDVPSCLLEARMPKPTRFRLLSKLGFATVSATAVVAPTSTLAAPRAASIADERDLDLDETDPPSAGRAATRGDARDEAGVAGRGLAFALSHAPGLVATSVAASWASSSDPARRIAVADALGWQFPLVGDDVVIDHLSRDPDPAIRLAAARAAWARRATGGDDHVLERLANDPDGDVRRVVILANWLP